SEADAEAGGGVHAGGPAPAPRPRGNLSLPSGSSASPRTKAVPAARTALDLTEEPAPPKPTARKAAPKQPRPPESQSGPSADPEVIAEEPSAEVTASDAEPTVTEEDTAGDLHFGPPQKTARQTSRRPALPADRPVEIPVD
ncbi:MAG: hypothetical protein ACK5YO_06590, partial [Planctomyces sp.]